MKTGTAAIASVQEELAQKLYKPLIKKFKRSKVYAGFKYIWAADLREMESLSSKDRVVNYLLCVIDFFIKYAWVKPLKDKTTKTVFNGFTEIVIKCKCKQNKLWVDQEK